MVVRVRTRSGTIPVGCQPKSTGGPIFACYLGTLMCHFMLTPICHHKLFVYKSDPARFSQNNKKKRKKVSLVSPNQPFSRQSPGLARKPHAVTQAAYDPGCKKCSFTLPAAMASCLVMVEICLLLPYTLAWLWLWIGFSDGQHCKWRRSMGCLTITDLAYQKKVVISHAFVIRDCWAVNVFVIIGFELKCIW